MAQPPILLTSIADCGKPEAVVVWDPIAGNPIANFAGDVAATGTLTATHDIILSAVAKKPIIQAWSFQSNSSFKRITTKGPVSALVCSDDGFFMYVAIEKCIYVYQIRGGCLIAVLEASHIASIEALTISKQSQHSALSLPLLLSSDTSGLVVCWPALVSPDDNVIIGNADAGDSGTSHHKPLWYAIQSSRGLPHCAFVADGRMVACAGTNGIKLFEAETGKVLYNTLLESRPILCICVIPQDDRYIFAGTDNGILHSIWLRDPRNPPSCEVSFRRCFTDSELSSSEKAICAISASPIDCGIPILAVSTRGGLVEILRQDSSLMHLQRFSVAPPGDAFSPRLTGFIMLPRPSWLLDAQTSGQSVGNASKAGDPLDVLRPFKRHLGWQLDDVLYMQLPNLKLNRLAESYQEGIYQDDFPRSKVPSSTAYAVLIDVNHGVACASGESAEFLALKREKEALEARNGELMRILVANCLHY
ncbi:hypothetical protein Aperf_G00000000931 [Anoplocephala perfoliata]